MPGPYRSSSGTNSKMSPGWQSSALQSASNVENRTALALLFFRMDRFAGVMPISSASSPAALWRAAHHDIQIDHNRHRDAPPYTV